MVYSDLFEIWTQINQKPVKSNLDNKQAFQITNHWNLNVISFTELMKQNENENIQKIHYSWQL